MWAYQMDRLSMPIWLYSFKTHYKLNRRKTYIFIQKTDGGPNQKIYPLSLNTENPKYTFKTPK